MKLNQLPDDRDQLEHDLQHHYTELTTTTKMDYSSGNEADGQEPSLVSAGGDSGTRRTSTRMKKPVIPISITHEPKKTRKRKNSQGKQAIQRKRRSNANLKATKTTVASPSNGNYSSFDEDDHTNNDEYRPKSHNYNKSNNYRISFESSMSSFVDDDDDSRHYTNGNNMITFPNTSINSSIVNHHHRNNNNNNANSSNKTSHLNANKTSSNFSHGNLMTNLNFVKSPKADYSRKNTSNLSAIAAQKKQQSNVTTTRAVVPTKPQIPVINLNSDEDDDEDEDDSDDESQEEDDDSRFNSTSVTQKLSPTVPSRVVQLPHLSHSQFRVPESAKLAASKVKSIFPTPLASLLSICPPPPLSSLNRSSLSSTKPASAPFSVKTNNNHNNKNNTSSPQTTAVQKQPQVGTKPKRKRAPRKPKLSQSKPPTKSAVKRRRSRSKSNLNTTTKQIPCKSPSKPVSKPNTGPIKPGPIPATNPLTLNSVKPSLSIGQSVRPCLLVSFQQPVVPPPPLPVEPVKYPIKLAIHRSRVVGPVVRIDKQQSSNKKSSKTTKTKNSKQKQPDSLNSTESAPVPIQYSLVNKLNEDTSANSGTGGVAGAGGSAISRMKKQLNQRLTAVTETSTDDWKCALCHQKPQSKFLGDLYGPYFVQEQLTNPLNSHLSKMFSSKQVSKYCSSMASQPISGQQTEVWVHEDCIVWSNVYAIGSKICNLDTAIQDSLYNFCRICGHPGASLACFVKNCYYSALHFPCAKEISCYFNEDNFTLFCPHHFAVLHQQQPPQIGGQQSNATSTSTSGPSNSRTPQAVNIAAVASCSSARTKIL